MYQLVNDNVHVYIPSKKIIMTPDNFEEINEVKLDGFILYKCIMGDPSDNIKGLDGYGKIKSKKLADSIVKHYASNPVENIYLDIINSNNISNIVADEQYKILQTNVKISWLGYIHHIPDMETEWNSYNEQYNSKDVYVFDPDILRELFNRFHFRNYEREISLWSRLFNKKSTNTMSIDEMLNILD